MQFQAKNGGNTEIFKHAQQEKLDNQLKEFMSKAQNPEVPEAVAEAKPEEIQKTESASKREVVQAS